MEGEAQTPPAGRELPATYVNRFHVIVGPITTRITFGEALIGLEADSRVAVAMKTTDALELGNLLIELIRKNQDAQAAAG